MSKYKAEVHEALNNAVKNGYRGWLAKSSAQEIADDLSAFVSFFENIDTAIYLSDIDEWQAARASAPSENLCFDAFIRPMPGDDNNED